MLVLAISLIGAPGCCEARLGTGESIAVGTPGSASRSLALEPSEPNLQLRCPTGVCSIAARINDATVDGLVEDQQSALLHFNRPGSQRRGAADRAESALLGGVLTISAKDLLNRSFTLRRVELDRGTALLPEKGSGLFSVDLREGTLVVNGSMQGMTKLGLRPRAGEAEDIQPTVLEVLLREPWRVSLVAIFLAAVPALAAFFVRLRSRKVAGAAP